MSLLSILDLRVVFSANGWKVHALDSVSFDLEEGGRLALVGETGCGKSVIGLAIPGLLPTTARVSGRILWKGRDLLQLQQKDLVRCRGRSIGLMPQNSAQSLNPLVRIGRQIEEVFRVHFPWLHGKGKGMVHGLLDRWGFDDPPLASRRYSHQLSGGMRQRVLLAICEAMEPELVIADEPTKGLDPLLRADAVENMEAMVVRPGRAMLLITHDLPVAGMLADQIAVMYAGQIVEQGRAADVLGKPVHPYTAGIAASLPEQGLHSIPGVAPSMITLPAGCRFRDRCSRSDEDCSYPPPLVSAGEDHLVRCFHPLG
ncbi:MAG: ABC transporter ATP-binding protein [Deltaproteobacteria bacterium]|nr:ABC transporter ATP-binding protein [Deltaproteobacteria bacterium]MBW2307349.1 ABC transporter ATP-binding protein [Deltaproteobacteria bacterium]